jgi:hypothetical protein
LLEAGIAWQSHRPSLADAGVFLLSQEYSMRPWEKIKPCAVAVGALRNMASTADATETTALDDNVVLMLMLMLMLMMLMMLMLIPTL